MAINSIPLKPLGAVGKSRKRQRHFRVKISFVFPYCKRSWNDNQFYSFGTLGSLWEVEKSSRCFSVIFTWKYWIFIHIVKDLEMTINSIPLETLWAFGKSKNRRVVLASFLRENIVYFSRLSFEATLVPSFQMFFSRLKSL